MIIIPKAEWLQICLYLVIHCPMILLKHVFKTFNELQGYFLKFKFILLVDIKLFSRLITFIRIAVTRTNMIFYLEKDHIVLITDIVHIYFNMMHTYLNLIYSLTAI